MDEPNFNELIQMKKEREAEYKAKYKVSSKERLGKIASIKIKTTMIGALETIEKSFGFLWESDNEDAVKFKDIFDKARSEILDRGNNQIRNLMIELDQYEVEWKRYHVQLPVKPLGGIG